MKNKKDTLFFANLIANAIAESEKKFPLQEATENDLHNFHEAILEYAETLK